MYNFSDYLKGVIWKTREQFIYVNPLVVNVCALMKWNCGFKCGHSTIVKQLKLLLYYKCFFAGIVKK
jgi:hypothetical protein